MGGEGWGTSVGERRLREMCGKPVKELRTIREGKPLGMMGVKGRMCHG